MCIYCDQNVLHMITANSTSIATEKAIVGIHVLTVWNYKTASGVLVQIVSVKKRVF